MSVIFLLGGARVSCIGVERHHRFAAMKLRVRVIVGIYRHGRDAMAQMWLSCYGPLRCGCRASRLIWLVSSKGLFSPVILVCHIARLLSLLSIVCYLDNGSQPGVTVPTVSYGADRSLAVWWAGHDAQKEGWPIRQRRI